MTILRICAAATMALVAIYGLYWALEYHAHKDESSEDEDSGDAPSIFEPDDNFDFDAAAYLTAATELRDMLTRRNLNRSARF